MTTSLSSHYKANSAGSFFCVPRDYIRMLFTHHELAAFLLAEIINIGSMDYGQSPTRQDSNGGWFRLPSWRLLSTFPTSQSKETRILAILKKLGFIETAMRGVPAKRWCRVDFEKLERSREEFLFEFHGAVPDDVEDDEMAPPSLVTGRQSSLPNASSEQPSLVTGEQANVVTSEQAYKRTLSIKDNTNVATPTEHATLSSGVVSSSTKQTKQPSKFDVKATQEFTAILDKVGVKYRAQDKIKWQHQFRLLREYDKASKDDIKAVIKWYANYYPDEKGQPYAIVCHSAKSFREKFFDKLLPRCQQSIPAKDAIVNRIRFLSLRDVQQAHRRDPEWGTNDFFRYTDDWKIGKYLADKEGHYREMAQIVNAARHHRPGEVRFILEAIGMYHLIVEDE